MKKICKILALCFMCVSLLTGSILLSGCTKKTEEKDPAKGVTVLSTLLDNMLDRDFLVTSEEDDEGQAISISILYDADNQIMYVNQTNGEDYNFEEYTWVNGNYWFNAEDENAEYGDTIYKYHISSWEDAILDTFMLSKDIPSNAQATIIDNNYVLTETYVDEGTVFTRKITYSDNAIIKMELSTSTASMVCTFNTSTSINLTVPEDFKALEEGAVEEVFMG